MNPRRRPRRRRDLVSLDTGVTSRALPGTTSPWRRSPIDPRATRGPCSAASASRSRASTSAREPTARSGRTRTSSRCSEPPVAHRDVTFPRRSTSRRYRGPSRSRAARTWRAARSRGVPRRPSRATRSRSPSPPRSRRPRRARPKFAAASEAFAPPSAGRDLAHGLRCRRAAVRGRSGPAAAASPRRRPRTMPVPRPPIRRRYSAGPCPPPPPPPKTGAAHFHTKSYIKRLPAPPRYLGGRRRHHFHLRQPVAALCSLLTLLVISSVSMALSPLFRGCGGAATRLHGISASRPRRRRDWSPRIIHRGGAATGLHG